MYYGEELGMTNNDPMRREDVKDPIGQLGWPKEKGRDGERTPMQWDASANAGFSSGKPWLSVPDRSKTQNVESELKDPDSVLNYYKTLLVLRHTNAALREGSYSGLNTSDPNVLAYLRQYRGETVLVALNMSGASQSISLELGQHELGKAKFVPLLRSPRTAVGPISTALILPPYGVYIGKSMR